MKKVKALFCVLAVAAAIGFVSCSTDSKYEEPKPAPAKPSEGSGDKPTENNSEQNNANSGNKTPTESEKYEEPKPAPAKPSEGSGDKPADDKPESFVSKYLTMKEIAAGTFKFKYGADDTAENVSLPAFKISDTEITQELYEAVMETNPSSFKEDASEGEAQEKRPVDSVSFYAALVFCNKLSEKEGLTPVYKIGDSTDTSKWGDIPTANDDTWNAVTEDENANGFRLPHEKEWMFAALGDKAENFSGFDNACFAGATGETDLNQYAWYKARFEGENNVNGGNSDGKTHQVAKKSHNSNGLFDMSGNLWELCWESIDNGNHVRRGGAFESEWTDQLAVSTRWDVPPEAAWNSVGFRIVQKSE